MHYHDSVIIGGAEDIRISRVVCGGGGGCVGGGGGGGGGVGGSGDDGVFDRVFGGGGSDEVFGGGASEFVQVAVEKQRWTVGRRLFFVHPDVVVDGNA